MLFETAIDIAHRKIDIATEEMDLCKLTGLTIRGGYGFRFAQNRESFVEPISNAHAFNLANPGRQPLRIVSGRLKGILECLD